VANRIYLVPWDVKTTTIFGKPATMIAGTASIRALEAGREIVCHGGQFVISDEEFHRLVAVKGLLRWPTPKKPKTGS
jgi:hypothetical protein